MSRVVGPKGGSSCEVLCRVPEIQAIGFVALHVEGGLLVRASGLDEVRVACGGVSLACPLMLGFQWAVPIGLKASRMFLRADGILLEECVGLASNLPPPQLHFCCVFLYHLYLGCLVWAVEDQLPMNTAVFV